MSKSIFIVTNSTYGDEYTPSTFDSLKEAQEWLKCVTICNFVNALDDPFVFVSKTTNKEISIDPMEFGNRDSGDIYEEIVKAGVVDEFYEALNDNEEVDVTARPMMSCISYGDDSYNRMEIYPVPTCADSDNDFVNKEELREQSKSLMLWKNDFQNERDWLAICEALGVPKDTVEVELGCRVCVHKANYSKDSGRVSDNKE